jgi:hypothetical protein
MTLSVKGLFLTLSINDIQQKQHSATMLSVIILAECHNAECHNAECHNAECHNADLCVIMLICVS